MNSQNAIILAAKMFVDKIAIYKMPNSSILIAIMLIDIISNGYILIPLMSTDQMPNANILVAKMSTIDKMTNATIFN